MRSKIADLVHELAEFVAEVRVFDPLADRDDVRKHYSIDVQRELPEGRFDAVVLAVNHRVIASLGRNGLARLLAPGGLVYDMKRVLPAEASDARL